MASGTCASENSRNTAPEPSSESSGTAVSSYNPFEIDICSLSLPACSPDVFCLTKKQKPQETNTDDSFRWSIGHVSALKPANIDENSQATVERWDEDKELRAQKAIETFFLHNSICPSPWNGAMAFKHVTFSPKLASTAYYSSSSSPFTAGNRGIAPASIKKDVWTQTTMTVPTDIDIFQLLGQFFTFLECQRDQVLSEEADLINDTKDFSNSSLRRKLFSPKRQEEPDPSVEFAPVPLPKSPLKFCTPEKSLQYKFAPTPSSGGTYFSSSPISVKSSSILASPMEHNLASPPVSPILTQAPKQCKGSNGASEKLSMFPSTPSAKKGTNPIFRFRSPSAKDGLDICKQSVSSRSASSSEKMDNDIYSQTDNDLDMESECAKFDTTQSSDMQVSVVQCSSDEKASAQLTGASTFLPYLSGQDTGYKTESYQQSLEGMSINGNESKERVWPKRIHNGYDSKYKDSVIEESDFSHTGEALVIHGLDNVLIEKSNWKPLGFSTPH